MKLFDKKHTAEKKREGMSTGVRLTIPINAKKTASPSVGSVAVVSKRLKPTAVAVIHSDAGVVTPPPVKSVMKVALDGSWCALYRPMQAEHAVLQPETARVAVERWLRRRLTDGDPKGPKVLVFKGPTGCGKASFVRAVSSSLGCEVEEPEGVDTFSKLLTIVREGACAHTLSLGADAACASQRRVWLFSGIDGYAEDGGPETEPETKAKHRKKTDVLERLLDLIKSSFSLRKSGRASVTMAPLVFTLQDFSNKTVRRLQNLEAVLYVNAGPLDREKCRYALTRIRSMALNVSMVIVPTDIEAVITYCYGDVRQCVLELQKTYYSRKYGIGRPSKADGGGKDVVTDVFETSRRILAIDRDMDVEGVTGMLGVHANGLQFLFSNWMFNLDFGVRRMTARQECDAMNALALGCDAWCSIHEAFAWRLGREPSLNQTECGVISGIMQLRETRNALNARTPSKLDYFKPLQRKGLPAGLDAVRTASLNGVGLKAIDLNERLWCACAIASCISRGLYSLPTIDDVAAACVSEDEDEYLARLNDVCVDKTSMRLEAIDPFFAKYGVPRHVAVAALPDYGGAKPVVPDWKILDVEGWKRQYRPGFTGVSGRVREAELAYLRNSSTTSTNVEDVAFTFLKDVCEPLLAETRSTTSRETFFQTMADYNDAVELMHAFYIEHSKKVLQYDVP